MPSVYQNLWNTLLIQKRFYTDKPVITYGDKQLSYDELLNNVKTVALFLQNTTVKEVVAIQLTHPFDSVVAVLATLVSQKAFWLVNSTISKSVNETILNQVFRVDDAVFKTALEANESLNITNEISSSSLFCWATSSGSITVPKITKHSYYSIMEDTCRQVQVHSITNNDRIDILSSLSFSASLSSIFPALFAGASLHIKEHSDSIADIYEFWKKEQITMTTLVPSLFRTLMKLPVDFKALSLRFVCISGEKILQNDLKLFSSKLNDKAVLQLALASSETRAIAEFISSAKELHSFASEISYKPVKDKKIIIVDDEGIEQSTGHVGRIAVISKVIGTGYVNSSDNFSTLASGERLFISNDFGKIMPDGKLYLSDKATRKVKFKGEFVDLDLFESLVLEINEVMECYATLNADNSELHVFVYSLLPQQKLRIALSEKLNNSAFVLHAFDKELPKLYSGKRDVKALNKLLHHEAISSTDFDNKKHPLHGIWKQIFPFENNFYGKHFFNDLGGDSLKAVELIVLLSEVFKRDFKLNIVYNYPVFDSQLQHIAEEKTFYLTPITKLNPEFKNILIFPHIDGNNRFLELIKHLQEKYNIYTVNYIIKENERFLTTTEIALKCADLLASEKTQFSLFIGHSYAGLITYYTAVYSKAAPAVFLVDTPVYSKMNRPEALFRFALRMTRFVLANLSDINSIKKELKRISNKANNRFGNKDTVTESPSQRLLLEYNRFLNRVADENHEIPVSNFKMGIFTADNHQFFNYKIAPDFSWEKYNSSLLFKKQLQGDHITCLQGKNINDIAAVICEHIS